MGTQLALYLRRTWVPTLTIFGTIAFTSGYSRASTFFDSMTNSSETGGLAGSMADGTPNPSQTWTDYWFANGDGTPVLNASYQTLSSSTASYTGNSLGVNFLTPQRSAVGTAFGTSSATTADTGAYIPVSPGNGGLITAQATVKFGSAGGSWACPALDPNLNYNAYPPDIYNNQGGIEMIVRPAISGDYAQFFVNTYPSYTIAYTPFGTEAGDLTTIPAADSGIWGLTHLLSMTLAAQFGRSRCLRRWYFDCQQHTYQRQSYQLPVVHRHGRARRLAGLHRFRPVYGYVQ